MKIDSMKESLNCIVIDDEPLACELLGGYVDQTPGLRLGGRFTSAADAVNYVMSGDVDLIFLDINMPLLNGIEFGKMIPARVKIIYITGYENYALDGFRNGALDYLLKPVSYEEFLKACGRAMEWFSMRDSYEMCRTNTSAGDTITVKSDYKLVQMKTDSILYVEVRKDRLIFFRKGEENVNTVMSMQDVEGLLPSIFMRVHRSFIVNLRNVEVVDRNRIVFGTTYVPISESKKEEFLQRMGVRKR